MVQPNPRPGADPRAREIKALKGMVAEQTCKLDEQTDQIVLLINENIDLRATIVRLNEDKEELEVELRLRKKASRKPDIKPPAESGKVRGGLAGQEKGKGKGKGGGGGKRRRGRKRGRDTAERVEVLIEDPPEGSHRKDFVERYVQVLRIDTQHLVYRLERRILPDGTTVTAELPTPATGNFSSTPGTDSRRIGLCTSQGQEGRAPSRAELGAEGPETVRRLDCGCSAHQQWCSCIHTSTGMSR